MAAPPRPDSIALLDRLIAALEAKGIVTEAEIAARQAITDKASPETGARMVARAWTDPAYRALLLSDGKAAAEQMGASMAGAPPLGVLENTPGRHHLVVCTLCSCYPRAVLGYPPNWYKSFAYRSRAVREPRQVLAEWGLNLPDSVEVRVVDSTADYRWMVLPMRPAGTEGWDEARLAALVTRDSLVGVAVPQAT
ncbi:nitrile hydratase subunit alpha [Roseomonas terrae]|uniref:Nitrile hydratase subunit alpha n=1 Tax=Neoroseomonas terrae TaxID=424799 RepID=A0ABS5ENC4_9PROT|nr:nitrile hydratase subunit alpha [Neoroseomonas terrae]MBR0652525.1 nitrile hydratase subunit alpha [Neoroseomonas terrae]